MRRNELTSFKRACKEPGEYRFWFQPLKKNDPRDVALCVYWIQTTSGSEYPHEQDWLTEDLAKMYILCLRNGVPNKKPFQIIRFSGCFYLMAFWWTNNCWCLGFTLSVLGIRISTYPGSSNVTGFPRWGLQSLQHSTQQGPIDCRTVWHLKFAGVWPKLILGSNLGWYTVYFFNMLGFW